MDPNACLQRMEDAIDARDISEAADAAEDLLMWIARGGFMTTSLEERWLTLVDRLNQLTNETFSQTETAK